MTRDCMEEDFGSQAWGVKSSPCSGGRVHAAGGSGSAIPEADKAAVRDNLLEGIVRAPPLVRAQLGECLKSIVYSDFPERWPGILQAVQQQLATQARPCTSTVAMTARCADVALHHLNAHLSCAVDSA